MEGETHEFLVPVSWKFGGLGNLFSCANPFLANRRYSSLWPAARPLTSCSSDHRGPRPCLPKAVSIEMQIHSESASSSGHLAPFFPFLLDLYDNSSDFTTGRCVMQSRGSLWRNTFSSLYSFLKAQKTWQINFWVFIRRSCSCLPQGTRSKTGTKPRGVFGKDPHFGFAWQKGSSPRRRWVRLHQLPVVV